MMETKPETPCDSLNGLSRGHPSLVVGLVNNMPDAALEATERQFRSLILPLPASFQSI